MLRTFLLVLGVWLAYWWTTTKRRRTVSRLARFAVVGSACALAAAFWLVHLPVEFYSFWYVNSFAAPDWRRRLEWFTLWHQDLPEWFPLHVLLVGALVGFLLADQRGSADGPNGGRRPRNSGAPRGGTAAGTPDGAGGLSGALKAAPSTLTLVVLILAVVVPPSRWTSIFDRLQGLKAPWFEVSFATLGGNGLTDSIRSSSTPSVQWGGGNAVSGQSGFITVRLQTLVELTHQPDVSAVTARRGVFADPVPFIIKGPAHEPPKDGSPGTLRTRRAQRDRAMILQIERLKGGSSDAAGTTAFLESLGNAQEAFLSSLAPHVSCLAAFIDATGDRRLVDYRSFHLAQHFLLLARAWSSAEKQAVLDGLRPAAQPEDRTAALWRAVQAGPSPTPIVRAGMDAQPPPDQGGGAGNPVNHEIRRIDDGIKQFAAWIVPVVDAWVAADRESDASTALRSRCEVTRRLAPVGAAAPRAIADVVEKQVRSGWFTPYVTIFAAQALSALDDHQAAIKLLSDWLHDLEDIRTAAAENHQDRITSVIDWYKLQVVVELLVLEKLSENTPLSVPVTLDALRQTLDGVFRPVLERFYPVDKLLAQLSSPGGCFSDKPWIAPIVFSYLTWVKDYLDMLYKDLKERPLHLTVNDAGLAELLAQAKLGCFDDIFAEKGRPQDQRAIVRTEFTITATTIRMLDYVAGGLRGVPEDGRKQQLLKADLDLQDAAAQLRRTLDAQSPQDGGKAGKDFFEPLAAQSERRRITTLLTTAESLVQRLAVLRGR